MSFFKETPICQKLPRKETYPPTHINQEKEISFQVNHLHALQEPAGCFRRSGKLTDPKWFVSSSTLCVCYDEQDHPLILFARVEEKWWKLYAF